MSYYKEIKKSNLTELKRSSATRLLELRKKRFPDMDHSRMDYLNKVISQFFGVEEKEVQGRNNCREYSEARQTIMYLAVEDEKLPLWYIGAYLDWRDHSTVIHGRDTVRDTLMGDKEYLKKFKEVKKKIKKPYVFEQAKTLEDINTFS